MGWLFAVLGGAQAQAAAGIRWHKPVRIESASRGGLQAVSCPNARFCAAVDGSGHVVYSTRPSGGGGSWSHPAHIDGAGSLTGISCPTAKLCVAVDDNGDVLRSTHPKRGAKGWGRPIHIDSVRNADDAYAGLLSISCPSTGLCVAVDGASSGDVLSTTDPLGGARAWRKVRVGVLLNSVSCPSTTLCVAAGAKHLFSTTPTGPRSSWHRTGGAAGGGMLSSIDCPAISLCVGVGFSDDATGLAAATATPQGSARTWRTVDALPVPPPDGTGVLDAVGCAGTKLCVALDSADNAVISTTPVRGGWGAPKPIRPNSSSQQNAISCTPRLCVVVDGSGVETTGAVHR